MKRSEALNLIANRLDFLSGNFQGVRNYFTKKELSNADVILTTLEQAGMLPPVRNADQKSSYGYARVYTWEREEPKTEQEEA